MIRAKRTPEFKRSANIAIWLCVIVMVWIAELPLIFFQVFITLAAVSFACLDVSRYYGEKVKECEEAEKANK